jgi:hypothetical protein
MNDTFYGFLVFFAFIALVGGINWLTTAIRNWNDGTDDTNDLLVGVFNMDSNVANVVYCVVFACTLALFLMVAFPNNLKKAFASVPKMPKMM